MRPLEILAGRPYPAMPDGYGDDLRDERQRIELCAGFALDVVKFRGLRTVIEQVAGSPIPNFDETARDLQMQQVGYWDIERATHNELAERRRAWRSDLIHLRGLRQALQQRRTN